MVLFMSCEKYFRVACLIIDIYRYLHIFNLYLTIKNTYIKKKEDSLDHNNINITTKFCFVILFSCNYPFLIIFLCLCLK